VSLVATGDAGTALRAIWSLAGGEPAALDRVELSGGDPILPTNFRVGTAAVSTIAAAGVAAAELWRLRTGRRQSVRVDTRAAAACFRGERYLRVNGKPAPDPWSPISGFYRTSDSGWIQLHCNFPHHRDGVLRLLGCAGAREEVERAVAGWKASALEDALAAAGMCAAMIRPAGEWRRHRQGEAVRALPLLEVTRIGSSRPLPCGSGERPLAGVRALDLTRVIAGPVCGRTLAEHGAEVLLITAAHLPSIESLVIDTGRGKLSAHLDLRRAEDVERLRDLARDADVFCQSYRPDSLEQRGFAPEELARLRPGIVCVSLSAYGHTGPWRDRRGFDTLVQSASGIAHENGLAAGRSAPRHLPAAVLDYASGYLAAFGAMIALARRAREGGSYLVRVSLAQTARWLDALGRIDGSAVPDLRREDIEDLLQTTPTPFGEVGHVAPAAQLSETPAFWSRPAVPLGTHPAEWG